MRYTLLTILAFSCTADDPPKADDTAPPTEDSDLIIDADGDGFPLEDDCDDDNAAVNPDADESCNGEDDDCDGEIDEADALDATTWYTDGDGDDYGDSEQPTIACEAPDGHLANGDDCDDGDSAVNPDATEVCDGFDNDCDGVTDGPDAEDASTWYVDSDADGYGDPDTTVTACEQPSNATGDATDCADDDATAYPGSTETEIPGDGIDQDCDGVDVCLDLNCDGLTDIFVSNYSNGSSYTVEQQFFYGDGEDFYPTADASLEDVGIFEAMADDIDEDGYQDLLLVSHYDGVSYSTETHLYWGSAEGYSTDNSTVLPTQGPLRAAIVDFDNDGYKDIVFGSYLSDSGYNTNSLVYYGSAEGFDVDNLDELPTSGPQAVRSSDLDNDGYHDLVFCDYYDGSSYDIQSLVYWGSSSGFSDADVTALQTHGCLDALVRDLNTDGYDDIVFANYYALADGYATDSYVYWGSASGFSESDRDDLPTWGTVGLTSGDFNGDGLEDLAFGGYRDWSLYTVSAAVYFGTSEGYSTVDSQLVTSIGVRKPASADLDNDGYDDLVLPSYWDGSVYESTSYVYYGSPTGLETTPTELLTSGATWVTIGDLDSDGYPELVFSNYYGGSWADPAETSIYWGSASGYAETDRTDLDTYGSWDAPLLMGDTSW